MMSIWQRTLEGRSDANCGKIWDDLCFRMASYTLVDVEDWLQETEQDSHWHFYSVSCDLLKDHLIAVQKGNTAMHSAHTHTHTKVAQKASLGILSQPSFHSSLTNASSQKQNTVIGVRFLSLLYFDKIMSETFYEDNFKLWGGAHKKQLWLAV